MKTAPAVKGVLAAAVAMAGVCSTLAALPTPPSAVGAAMIASAVVKIALLCLAGRWSLAAARRLGPDHEASGAWSLLGAGFLGMAAGHLVLAVEQFASPVQPYPAFCDLLFIPSQALLAVALFRFLGVYRSSELFPDERVAGTPALIGAGAAVLGGALVACMLRLPAAGLERAVDVLYVAIDVAILVPLALLVGKARTLRGEVGRVWAMLLASAAVFGAADVALGYLHAFGAEPSDLALQFPFVLAYALAAAGCRLQLAVVAE